MLLGNVTSLALPRRALIPCFGLLGASVTLAYATPTARLLSMGATGPRDVHSLDYPYQGLVVEVVDADDPHDRAELDGWLRADFLPARLAGSAAAMTLLFEPMPLPADKMAYVADMPGLERRLTLLTFTEVPPAAIWDAFAGAGKALADSGLGRVQLAAPFVPTLPGTDVYVDQLR